MKNKVILIVAGSVFLALVIFLSILGSSMQESSETAEEKTTEYVQNTYPLLVRIDGVNYRQDSASGYYDDDITARKVDFVVEGKIESVTKEFNTHPRKDNQTNCEELVGCEYGHMDGKLYILYKRQLVEYVESEYQP